MDPLGPTVLLLLVAAAFLAGFIDSQVGGGGIITLPALLAAGLPPHLALGTNKLVATGASSVATANYAHQRLIPRRALWLAALALAGTVAGALLVLRIAAASIQGLVLAVMAAMTLYVLLRPAFGRADRPERRTPPRLASMAALTLAIGFYDGFLGPGTGTFLLFALTAVLGLPSLPAAAMGRLLNLASNVGALAVFAAVGVVSYKVGLPMLLGTVTGGWVGSRVAIRGGDRWVRWLFVAVAVALMAKLAWDIMPRGAGDCAAGAC